MNNIIEDMFIEYCKNNFDKVLNILDEKAKGNFDMLEVIEQILSQTEMKKEEIIKRRKPIEDAVKGCANISVCYGKIPF